MSDLISRQWLMECVKEGWIKFDTEKDENVFIHLVRDIAPSAQPKRTEERTETHASDCISRREAIEALFDWEMTYDWDDHCREEDPKPAYIVSPSDVIEQLPSTQPEIIRCKNCKAYLPETETLASYCPVLGIYSMPEDAYCFKVQRKEK